MLKSLVNEARFTLRIETTGPLLVKSGHASLDGPDMAPVQTYRNGAWHYYIPGSSLKGVIRSHLEKVIRTLRPGVTCNPFLRQPEPVTDMACSAKFDRRRKANQVLDAATVYADSCPICRLFGSTSYAGRAGLSDAYPLAGTTIHTEMRDGVGIDRLTGGAAHRAKFDLQAVSTGAVFTSEVLLRNFECWQLGALLLALTDLEDGLISIGSGRSRGLGAVRATLDGAVLAIHEIGQRDEQAATDVWGIGRVVGDGRYGTEPTDTLSTQERPRCERHGVRYVSVYDGEALQQLRHTAVSLFVNRITQWSTPPAMTMGVASIEAGGTAR